MADETGLGLPDWMGKWPIWAVLTMAMGLPAFRTVTELVKWVARFASGREDVRAKRLASAQEQFEFARASLLTQMQDELAKARSMMDAYEGELAKMRRARSSLADVMVELRSAALAARAMVHEMERRAGDPTTIFKPLPSWDEVEPMRR